ncbi:class I tRNA ligase family protein, partial [Candidatus Saccharibacteria bacterium]|nr:class I tRNA ligase family protein [Candidatus Saccharibacteria bacterium]
GNWLAEIKDWGISRLRYWGTPLPVWKSESGKVLVIGSFAELEKYSGKKITDPHRPFVDEITFSKDGETYTRIPDVIDVWYDSGSMPFARFHYPFENKEKFEQKFPAQYIAEGVDQTRGWFYSLLAISTSVFDKPAFQNVVVNGFTLDDNGVKLSKSKKNYSPPDSLIENFGADAIRLNFFSSPITAGEDATISETTVKLQT